MMVSHGAENVNGLSGQMEGGVFYRVAFLCILSPDRAEPQTPPATRRLRCPFRQVDVELPIPVADGIASTGGIGAIVPGADGASEQVGYVAYLTERDAREAARIIA